MPRLLLYYHFFHPNDVVSARQFTDLAVEQSARGWQVTAVTSNRDWHDPAKAFAARTSWRGVDIHRVHRPAWPQARALSRLGNSAYMLGAWAHHTLTLPPADVVVLGSDPAFAALLAIPLKRMRPHTPIVHWCFDLYPDAIQAEADSPADPGSMEGSVSTLVPLARSLMSAAYRACDVLVDIGSTMRRRLLRYVDDGRAIDVGLRHETLTPWALFEPPEPASPDARTRASLFPDAKLTLLYAGTMGRAHEFDLILALARACRARSFRTISFCFACRGNRMDELRAALRPDDTNVSLAPFGAEADLPARLASADLHIVSLRSEWQGVVVPSKFFASLAAGRPVLFTGPHDSEIAEWIDSLHVGLTLHRRDDVTRVVDHLHQLAQDPAALAAWQRQVHASYAEHFSKRVVNNAWDRLLRDTVSRGPRRP